MKLHICDQERGPLLNSLCSESKNGFVPDCCRHSVQEHGLSSTSGGKKQKHLFKHLLLQTTTHRVLPLPLHHLQHLLHHRRPHRSTSKQWVRKFPQLPCASP